MGRLTSHEGLVLDSIPKNECHPGGDTHPIILGGGPPSNLGGGNSKIFYVHPDPWGDDPI